MIDFAERYGPWAVIAGASDGTGREFARKIAAQGVNCFLIARREGPLAELAELIRKESGVECATASIDLAAPDSFERVVRAVGDREVGLYVGNAGADPNGSRFLDADLKAWVDLVHRNVLDTLQCCYHFAKAMKARGRGGLLLVNSGACYGGAYYLATYSATKAFELNFAEGLWAELKPHGVDVLTLVLISTDTPAFRAIRAKQGLPVPDGLASPVEVAEVGLARLPHGPIHNWSLADDDPGYAGASAAARRARVQAVSEQTIFFNEGGRQ
jgi:short-subunit dehydrogenase